VGDERLATRLTVGMSAPEPTPRLLYVGDPMCSWCWGFAPVLDRVQADYRLAIEVIVGGLSPGPAARPLDDRLRAMLEHHWSQVHEASGQPFDRAILDREDFVYDTEPAAAAVVAMRELSAPHALPYLVRLQRAFYAEARDITRLEPLVELAREFPVDAAAFVDRLVAPDTRTAAWSDFRRAHDMGISGFPALIGVSDAGPELLSPGYLPYERLATALDDWGARAGVRRADGRACRPGEAC
jgi:putative protein-disulfide isomerase